MHVRLLRRTGAAFIEKSPRTRMITGAGIALLIGCTAWLVYATGGARFSYLHLMYVPIIVAGIAFGVPGGLVAAGAAGLALGPWMPLNTATGEMQASLNWVYRLVFFSFVGLLVGTWSQLLRRHLRELEWLHEHHADSGLLNLPGLLKELDVWVRADQKFVVSVIQLNSFPEVQNTFGAAFGDRLLTAVVGRVQTVVPDDSLVALIQPDRLVTVVSDARAISLTRERLESTTSDSFVVDGVPVYVDTSIGVSRFPEHARTGEELLQRASIAMHWALSRRSLVSVYDVANDRTSRENLILLGAVPAAIERGEFEVWHQAKLALVTDQIAGSEALLRWKSPERGYVQPGSFVPQLEETSLIDAVTYVVISKAFQAAGAWRAAGHHLRVSINLSVRNLLDRSLLEVLERERHRHELEPGDVELEVTESAVMADPQHCIRLIGHLRDQGYGVAIDDFGVGHSSLSYLQKLQISTLKIDQEFVKTLATDASNQKIVRSILHLSASLGLETVAEGVEDKRSLELLRDWGCNYGQGYYIHRPAPVADVTALLAERGHRARPVVQA